MTPASAFALPSFYPSLRPFLYPAACAVAFGDTDLHDTSLFSSCPQAPRHTLPPFNIGVGKTCFVRGQIEISGFAGHMVSVTTIHVCSQHKSSHGKICK